MTRIPVSLAAAIALALASAAVFAVPPTKGTATPPGQAQIIQSAPRTLGALAMNSNFSPDSTALAPAAIAPHGSSSSAPLTVGTTTGSMCSTACAVTCAVTQPAGDPGRTYTQYWAAGGGPGCPAAGSPTGYRAVDVMAPPFACAGTQAYIYSIPQGTCP